MQRGRTMTTMQKMQYKKWTKKLNWGMCNKTKGQVNWLEPSDANMSLNLTIIVPIMTWGL